MRATDDEILAFARRAFVVPCASKLVLRLHRAEWESEEEIALLFHLESPVDPTSVVEFTVRLFAREYALAGLSRHAEEDLRDIVVARLSQAIWERCQEGQ